MASLHIHRLLDHPGMIDTVAGWIDAEWGAFSGRTLDRTRTRFTEDAAAALPRSYVALDGAVPLGVASLRARDSVDRSEEHTSELQSLMSISYAVFCLKKKTNTEQKEQT